MRVLAYSFAAGLALAASACRTTPDTAIRVEIASELAASHAISRVHVRTYDWSAASPSTIDEHDFRIGIDTVAIPFSLTVAPRDLRVPNQHVGIEVVGYVNTGATVIARMNTAFIPGQIRTARLVLRETCVVGCSSSTTCAASGACVEAYVDPNSLPMLGQDASDDAAIDAVDDVTDAFDATVDMGVDATVDTGVDVRPDVPQDARTLQCPEDAGSRITYCSFGAMCGGPPGGQQGCCLVMPQFTACNEVTCPGNYHCMIDPMNHPACCGMPE